MEDAFVTTVGSVRYSPTGLTWRVIFPDVEHVAAASYLRELAASDCSPSTPRSYAYDLLRWSRFLHDRLIPWDRAERLDVRQFVEYLLGRPPVRAATEHLIAAHQAFVERRRLLRPEAEGQVADDVEWDEFEQHFLLRRVALGECHRPYGTPCVHEHACTRFRFLRVDPAQLGRIEEMPANAEDRLTEAHEEGLAP